jgi:DDE superfamily endonuclease
LQREKRAFWSEPAVVESRPIPPSIRSAEEARAALIERIHRGPPPSDPQEEEGAGSRSRWQLSLFKEAIEWMRPLSLSGICRSLKRLDIGLKRGRDYIHSPDPQYVEKMEAVELCLERAKRSRGRESSRGREVVALYTDELGYYRQPVPSRDYEERGSGIQPLARRSMHENTIYREVAALNPLTGELIHHGASKMRVRELLRFYRQIVEAYPQAKRIYLIEDNWPVHYHPLLLCYLEDQETRFELKIPPAWKSEKVMEESRRIRASLERSALLPIQIVPLPTYAPWTDPQEKVWRKLRQEYLNLHRYADEWEALKQGVKHHLDQFRGGSRELLRYVGLLPEEETGHKLAAVAAAANGPP